MTAPDPTTAEAALTEDERAALLAAWPWPQEAATTRDGFADVVTAVERILAARLAPASALAAAVEALADEWERRHRASVRSEGGGGAGGGANKAADLRALLAAHPAPVPDQQAVAAITEWFMREHFGRDLEAMDADEAWAKPLANYRDHYGEKARAILAALATGQGPDTGGAPRIGTESYRGKG